MDISSGVSGDWNDATCGETWLFVSVSENWILPRTNGQHEYNQAAYLYYNHVINKRAADSLQKSGRRQKLHRLESSTSQYADEHCQLTFCSDHAIKIRENDLFFVCCYIQQTGHKQGIVVKPARSFPCTHSRLRDRVRKLGSAAVSTCLSSSIVHTPTGSSVYSRDSNPLPAFRYSSRHTPFC